MVRYATRGRVRGPGRYRTTSTILRWQVPNLATICSESSVLLKLACQLASVVASFYTECAAITQRPSGFSLPAGFSRRRGHVRTRNASRFELFPPQTAFIDRHYSRRRFPGRTFLVEQRGAGKRGEV